MTLPTTAPWATDTNFSSGADSGTATKVAYSGGAQAQGFLPGVEPSAQGLNEWMNRVGAWTVYLAGGTTWTDVVIGGSLSLTGAQAYTTLADGLNSNIDFTGGGTLTGVYEVNVSYTGGATGTGQIGGIQGGIPGMEILIRNADSTKSFQIINQDSSSTATRRIAIVTGTGLNAILLRPQGWVRLRYQISLLSPTWHVVECSPNVLTGGFTTVSAVQMQSVQTAIPTADPSLMLDGSAWQLGSTSGQGTWAPIPLPVGSLITFWTTAVNKLTNGSDTVSATLQEVDLTNGTIVTIGSTQTNNANAPGSIPLGQTVPSGGYTTLTDKAYRIELSHNTTQTSDLRCWGVRVQRFA